MPAKRRRHVPLRTCVACRQKRAKRELVRVVRTPEGAIEIDPRGKRSGRGAYVCLARQCLAEALVAGTLGRALKCSVTAEQISALKSVARDMLEETLSAEETAAELGGTISARQDA